VKSPGAGPRRPRHIRSGDEAPGGPKFDGCWPAWLSFIDMDQMSGCEDGPSPVGSCGTVPLRAATEGELNDASSSRRLLALSDQRRMSPHDGVFKLETEGIILQGWRTLERRSPWQLGKPREGWGSPGWSARPVSNRCTSCSPSTGSGRPTTTASGIRSSHRGTRRHARPSGTTSLVTLAGEVWEW
jgi:hypothetical protein